MTPLSVCVGRYEKRKKIRNFIKKYEKNGGFLWDFVRFCEFFREFCGFFGERPPRHKDTKNFLF